MRLSALVLFSAIFLCTAASQSSAIAAGAIGKVAATVGTPSASGPGGDRDLKAGAPVYEDDKIVVRNGNAQIILDDGTKLVIGPGSTLVLDRFLMKGGGTAQKVSIKALRGTFRFITGRSAKSAYDIRTANATIGIRGTGFDLWARQETGAAVLDGNIRLCSDKNKNCVDVHEGCEVGRAGGGEATLLAGRTKGQSLVRNFPFILRQASLRSDFHLPVQDCKSSLPRQRELGGGDSLPEQDSQPDIDNNF